MSNSKKVRLALGTIKPVKGSRYECTVVVRRGRYDYELQPVKTSSVQWVFRVSDDVYLVETRHTLYVVKDRTIPGNTKLVGMYETPRVGDRFSCFDVTDCNKAERRVYQTSTIKSVDFLSQEVCEVKTKNSTYYCYF